MSSGLHAEFEKLAATAARLRARIEQAEEFKWKWRERVQLALRKGADDLAREALLKEVEMEGLSHSLRSQLHEVQLEMDSLHEIARQGELDTMKLMLLRIAEEAERLEASLLQAKAENNRDLEELISTKLLSVMQKGRTLWNEAFPSQEVDGKQCKEANKASSPNLYSADIEDELEHLKRQIDHL